MLAQTLLINTPVRVSQAVPVWRALEINLPTTDHFRDYSHGHTSLKNTAESSFRKIHMFGDNRSQVSVRGPILFTHH